MRNGAARGPRFPARTRPYCPDESGPDSGTASAAKVTAFVDRGGAIPSTNTDTDSHGVSDPSGQAGGHFQRAHRGRSRHVSCADRGTGACAVGGKERRPSCWCRALTVELAARASVVGGAGGRPSLASLMSGGSSRTRSGGQPRFPRSSPRSSSAVVIRRRQPGGRDAGTAETVRRIRPVRVRGR